MTWKDIYKGKLMSAQDAAKIIKSGDRFWTPLCLGQPTNLIMDAVADRKGELKDVEYNFALILRPYKIFQPEFRDSFKLVCAFYSAQPFMQQLAQSEWANFFPCQSSDISIKVAERTRTIPRRLGMTFACRLKSLRAL